MSVSTRPAAAIFNSPNRSQENDYPHRRGKEEREIKEGFSSEGLDREGDRHRDGGGGEQRQRGHGGQAEDAATTAAPGGAGPGLLRLRM